MLNEMLCTDCFPRDVSIELMGELFTVRFESKEKYKNYATHMTEIKKWYNAFVTHVDTDDGALIGVLQTNNLACQLVIADDMNLFLCY